MSDSVCAPRCGAKEAYWRGHLSVEAQQYMYRYFRAVDKAAPEVLAAAKEHAAKGERAASEACALQPARVA